MGKKKRKLNTCIGTFSQAKGGYGFVICDDDGDDIFIKEKDTAGAMHGDIVEAAISDVKSGKKREGVIVHIVEHKTVQVVGTVERGKNFAFVIPDNSRIGKDIFIPKGKLGDAKHGQKVVVSIIDYGGKGKKSPEGEVIDILGYPDEKGVDILSIAKSFGIPEAFPYEVIKESRTIPKTIENEDISDRTDLRDIVTITIDGEDAKDLDDAVSLSYENGVYTLGVHIADVSHYVTEGSLLNEEAVNRGTSVYLIDRVVPMLPKRLSNGICSLNENVDRCALSCIMKLDDNGHVIDHKIVESVINVNHRMTYTSVNKIVSEIKDEKERRKYADIVPMLEMMRELAEKRMNIRAANGAIDFDFPESKIILDKKGKPIAVKPYDRNIATRMIEEFMLVTNETIAEDYFWQEIPFVYRTHEAPDSEKIRELSVFISNFGFKVKALSGDIHPKEIQKLLSVIKGEASEDLISRLTLRSMKRAEYTVTADGHFGLASRYYCHFTSPIRRYPDLIIHRIIKENLHGKMNQERIEHYNEILPEIASMSSKLERRAEEAEREAHKLKKAEYMLDHLGESYTGVISGVTSWGIYVMLDNTIEGMIRLEEMIDDDYTYDEGRYLVRGHYSGKEYALGERVDIIVLRASLETKTIDFMLDYDKMREEEVWDLNLQS